MSSLCDLVSLQNGQVVPRFVFELVWACDWAGIRLEVIDGDVIPTSDDPHMIDDELLEDLAVLGPGVAVILLNTPDDRHTDARR